VSPKRGRAVAWLCWLYLTLILAVWALVALASDEWWPATLLMFLPRWMWALPLVLLAPLAAWRRPHAQWILLAGGIVVAWQLMGFSIPWNRLSNEESDRFRCRVLTCNVHRNPFGIKGIFAEIRPDIVVLQDCPHHFEPTDFGEGRWYVWSHGQFVLASRYPILEPIALEPPEGPRDAAVRARLKAPGDFDIRFYVLHLESPRDALVALRRRGLDGGEVLQTNSNTRRSQSAAITAWILKDTGPLLIAGDFNTPSDSTIYNTFWSDYSNAFSEAGLGWGHTYHANHVALRIDHILAGPGWRCRHCWVGPEVGSEHRPVIADMEWVGAGK